MSDLFLDAPHEEQGEVMPASRRSRRADKAAQARRRKRRRRRTLVVLALVVVVVGGAAFMLRGFVTDLFDGSGSDGASVQDYPGPGSGEVQVTVNAGDSGAAIGDTLVHAGVVATVKAFTDAYAANPQSQSIQPGTYGLVQQMRAADAVNALLDPESRVSNRVTIPEGYTAEQIFERIYEVTTISVEDLEAAAADPAAIGLPDVAGGHIEGWLYPATYEVEPDSSAASVLAQMVAKTAEVLTAKGVAEADWETVLNKASIVEREGKLDEDRPKIARAIENRLALEMPLQVDAVVAYGLGKSGTDLTSADLSSANTNPYNSRIYEGLPPTPIASPGEASIDAVLNPAEGNWLFWVTVNLDTGETKFAETYAEHQENVNELNAWLATNS